MSTFHNWKGENMTTVVAILHCVHLGVTLYLKGVVKICLNDHLESKPQGKNLNLTSSELNRERLIVLG